MSTRQWNSEQVGARWESLGGDKPDVPSVGGGGELGIRCLHCFFVLCLWEHSGSAAGLGEGKHGPRGPN